jgi:hypothetical protein
MKNKHIVSVNFVKKYIFMTKEDRQKAEQIIRDFPSWNRPMSTEESNLVDRFREIQLSEMLNGEYEHSFPKISKDKIS